MPFYILPLDPREHRHVAEHGLSQEEFEEVVTNPEGETISRSSGNPIAFGANQSGRVLCCVFRRIDDDVSQPITAFEVGE
jgi:hypothetical protein